MIVSPVQALTDVLFQGGEAETILLGALTGISNISSAIVSNGIGGLLATATANALLSSIAAIADIDEVSTTPLSGCGVPGKVR